MKGKRIFSENEARKIRDLINKKIGASKSEQKSIRNEIRGFGFYFSDFSNKKGYTVEDFDDLVKTGEIEIIGKEKIENSLIKKEQKKFAQFSKNEKSNFANTDIEKELITEGKFVSIKDLHQSTLDSTGFYCIKLKPDSKLPERYQSILDQRKYKQIYIGKAEGQTLKDRLSQELELKRPGTFFRSIGCILGHLPIKGHLKGKSNQNNFKFPHKEKLEIIEWLRNNVELSIVKYNGDFTIESVLIKKYNPLLNDYYNPLRLQELKDDKDTCRKYAREK